MFKGYLTPPRQVSTDLESARTRLSQVRAPTSQHNLSRELREAHKSLKQDDTIVINKADKGSSITILDASDYAARGRAHLSDTNTYEPIDSDPSLSIQAKINLIFRNARDAGWISEGIAASCRRNPDETKTQYIYFLLKTHKVPHQVRPIVSGRGGPTEFASAFLDNIMQPYVNAAPQTLLNSIHLVNMLQERQLPDHTILFVADVKSLYTSIPQLEGIHMVLSRLYHGPIPAPSVPKQLLRQLLLAVIQDNVFSFQDQLFRQRRGVAMGTRCAPAFANLFMLVVEDRMFSRRNKSRQPVPLLWRRYIDDVIGLWDHGEDALSLFITELNQCHHALEFKVTHSHTSVDFLDLTIYKGDRFGASGILDTKLFRKPCDHLAPLPYHSAHPPQTFKGIFVGEVKRLIRNTSNEDLFSRELAQMVTVFKSRGYPFKRLLSWLADLAYAERHSYLHPSDRPRLWCTDFAPLSIIYKRGLTRPLIRAELGLEEYPFEPRISFRAPRNLLRSLTASIKTSQAQEQNSPSD